MTEFGNTNATMRTGSGYESYGNMLGPPVNVMRVPINCILDVSGIQQALEDASEGRVVPMYQVGTAVRPHDALCDSLFFAKKDGSVSGAAAGLIAGISTLNGLGNRKDHYLDFQDEFYFVGKVGGDSAFFHDARDPTPPKRDTTGITIEASGPVQIKHRGKESINSGDLVCVNFPDPQDVIVEKGTGHIYPETRPYRPRLEAETVKRLRGMMSSADTMETIRTMTKPTPLQEGAMYLEDFARFFFAFGAVVNSQNAFGNDFNTIYAIIPNVPNDANQIIRQAIGEDPMNGILGDHDNTRRDLIPSAVDAIERIFHHQRRNIIGWAVDSAPMYGDDFVIVLGGLASH